MFKGLSEEEQAALMSMPPRQAEASTTPQSSAPAPRAAANKGTKRAFPGASHAAAPTALTSPAAGVSDGLVSEGDAACDTGQEDHFDGVQTAIQGAKKPPQSKPVKRAKASGDTAAPVVSTPSGSGMPIPMCEDGGNEQAEGAYLLSSVHNTAFILVISC